MGDLPNNNHTGGKHFSVAEIVQAMEAKQIKNADRVSVTNKKKITTLKKETVITDQLGTSSSVVLTSQSGTLSDNVTGGNERQHQIANVPQIGLSTSIETVNIGNGSEYHTRGIGCTISQIVPCSDGLFANHNSTDETLRYPDHKKHDQQKSRNRYKQAIICCNEKIHTSPERTNEEGEYKSCFVDNPDSVGVEVDLKSAISPHNYWESFLKDQVGPVTDITPLNPQSEIGHNCIRFVCMSDTHNRINPFNTHHFLGRVPAGDVLLHTGDFTLDGVDLQEYENFNNLLKLLPHRIKLAIPGNHEVYLDSRLYSSDDKFLRRKLGLPITPNIDDPMEHIDHLKSMISNAIVLIDDMVEFCGIKIYGLPWVPLYGVYGFGLARGYSLLEKYNQIPAGIDILMSHGPALGFCDVSHKGRHVGCAELLNSVRQRIKPKYVVHGHIHEAYGVQSDGRTTFINASICDHGYNLSHDPIVFDYPLPHPFTREDFLRLNLDDLQLSSWDNS